MATKVIFRKWGQIVIAIFPEVLGNYSSYTCMSYVHIGQHCACDPQNIIDNSTPANETEYHDLKSELESIGYSLKVIKRLRYSHLQTRQEELKHLSE